MRYEGHRHLLTAVLALFPLAIALLAILSRIQASHDLLTGSNVPSMKEPGCITGYEWPDLSQNRLDSLKASHHDLYRQADQLMGRD